VYSWWEPRLQIRLYSSFSLSFFGLSRLWLVFGERGHLRLHCAFERRPFLTALLVSGKFRKTVDNVGVFNVAQHSHHHDVRDAELTCQPVLAGKSIGKAFEPCLGKLERCWPRGCSPVLVAVENIVHHD